MAFCDWLSSEATPTHPSSTLHASLAPTPFPGTHLPLDGSPEMGHLALTGSADSSNHLRLYLRFHLCRFRFLFWLSCPNDSEYISSHSRTSPFAHHQRHELD